MALQMITELARSASMYTEPPVVHTVQEIKAAAYQVKCKRATTDDIVEFEVPFYLLREAEPKEIGTETRQARDCAASD